MQPVDGLGAGTDEIVAVFGEAARAAIASSITAVVSRVAVCAARYRQEVHAGVQ